MELVGECLLVIGMAALVTHGSAEVPSSVEVWPMVTRAPPSGDTLPPTLLSALPAGDGCWCGPAPPGGGWDDVSSPDAEADGGSGGGGSDGRDADAVGAGVAFRVAGPCKRVPVAALAAAQPPPRRLVITRTAVRSLHPGDFAALGMALRALHVVGNAQLDSISIGAFEGLTELRFLSLSQNSRLRRLAPGAMRGLQHLQELRLEADGVRSVEDVSLALGLRDLPSLSRLSLSENSLQRLSEGSLLPLEGSPLRDLRLSLCQLREIHPKALRPLRHLRALRLGRNVALGAEAVAQLLRSMVEDSTPLRLLELDQMGFRGTVPFKVLSAAADLGVTWLSLARNQFPELSSDAFPAMPHLRHLDLSECLIVSLEAETFGADSLPVLRSLVLSGNHLTGIVPGVLPPQVASLDISLNMVELSRRGASFDLGEGSFAHMVNLTHLNVSFNNIISITPNTFRGLGHLKEMLSLQNASIIEIQPGSFKELANLTFLNLERNPFPDYSGLTRATFEGLASLEVLMLSECGITNFSDPEVFSPVGSLQYLMLEHNHISNLKPQVLAPLTDLRGLDLSHNRIESWMDERMFSGNPNLSKVFLADNKLTYLSPEMLEDFSKLDHLDIYDNPFSCECEPFYRGKDWLSKTNLTLDRIFPPGRAPVCYTPDSWKNKLIIDFIQLSEYDGECPTWAPGEGIRAYIIVGVMLGMLMVLGSVCGAMAYKYRSYIRYWMFLARRDLRRRGLTLRKERRRFCKGYTNYQYDAFVSYSSEDRNFVVRLVAMLENYEPHLKLCVYERDFQIGTVISEAVLESVACSRRTLLIVSDAFARSQWCMWELRLAEHYSLFFDDDECGRRQDPLVMVRLGQVAATHMTPTLRHLLQTRVYLEWDAEPRKQRIFWEKLRGALSPPKPVTVKTTVQ